MWIAIVTWYIALSIVTLGAFAMDKRAAAVGRLRIPEKTLHALELLGGWPGAIAGQMLLRHKSSKLSFRVVLWLIVALHLAAWGFWFAWRQGWVG
jgi:uncharacterized membrane protein YsdA (DUF1294 family)